MDRMPTEEALLQGQERDVDEEEEQEGGRVDGRLHAEHALSHCVGVVRENAVDVHAQATEKEERERGKRGPEGSPAELVDRPEIRGDARERYHLRTDLVRLGGHGRAFYAHCRPVDHRQRVAMMATAPLPTLASWGPRSPLRLGCGSPPGP